MCISFKLDLENTALARVVNPQVEMNITDLTDKLKQLKLALKQACNSTETDFDYNCEYYQSFLFFYSSSSSLVSLRLVRAL